GAAPAVPVSDALWRGEGGRVVGTQDRTGLFRAQTPQAFRYEAILAAHRAHPGGAADDVEVARAAGLEVAIVEGCEDNLKVTYPGDFARAERLLALAAGL
ncbi:IspD/TarI family cytidylyltransferase, partial [Cereibacter johrii]